MRYFKGRVFYIILVKEKESLYLSPWKEQNNLITKLALYFAQGFYIFFIFYIKYKLDWNTAQIK